MTDHENPAFRYVGLLLAYFRQQVGMTQAELGRRIYCTDSLIAHMEKGRRPAAQPWLDRADSVLGAGGMLSAAEELLSFERHSPIRMAHPELRQDAAALHFFATHVVPDLLQRPAYAKAVLSCRLPPMTQDDIDTALSTLAGQQSILSQVPAPALSFVLDESVLRRRVGGPQVMYEQLCHLLGVARRPHVTMQVAPLGRQYYPGLTRATTVVEARTGNQLVYVDCYDGVARLRDREEIVSVTEQFNLTRAYALPPEDSALLIKEIAEEFAASVA